MESDNVLVYMFHLLSSASVYNPFEVIIALISLFISISLMSSTNSTIANSSVTSPKLNSNLIFKLTEIHTDETDHQRISHSYFNFLFSMFIRCAAISYIFIQLKSIRKMHSKLKLLTSLFFTIFSSILFNFALISWYHFEIPYNLVSIFSILNLALEETDSIKDAKSNLVKKFAHFSSKSSLDTIFIILFVALGDLSDSNEIKNYSIFSCVLLTCNFLVFATIYPAFISLILQFNKKTSSTDIKKDKTQKQTTERGSNQADFLSDSESNPVLDYVKYLMMLFLLLIQLKSKLFTISSSIEITSNKQTTNFIMIMESVIVASLIIFIFTKYFRTKFIFKLENTPTPSVTSALNEKTGNTSNQTQQVIQHEIMKCTISTQTETVEEPKLTSKANTCAFNELKNETIAKLRNKEVLILDHFSDDEIIELIKTKDIPLYKLESYFTNATRGVEIRRKVLEAKLSENCLAKIPFDNYNYRKVIGHNCENVIGYVPIPLGYAGPLLIDGTYYHIPMATTEGTLVASTNRGCNALSAFQGVFTKVIADGMTRGPVMRFPSAMKACDAKEWLEREENKLVVKHAFESTSRFAKLRSIKCCVASRYLYIRFCSSTGDAMGMNMLSKGTEKALNELQKHFPESEIMSLSGNYCTDKKPSAMNWLEGRGKSVVVEAVVKAETIKTVLKTSAKALYDLNLAKNLLGSAMAGSIGGFNAHAANIVAAIFIACGQDPAQVVESSTCLTWMEITGENNDDLYISCTMPSLEVGTVGGGTGLDAQTSCLQILGINHENRNNGEHSCKLATIIAAGVLAGELSLMSALASGQLVNSHMKYNRAATAETIRQLTSNMHCFI